MSRQIIDQAIRENRRLFFTYTKYSGEKSTRSVSKIKYCNEFGDFGYNNDHIRGYCHLRNEDRTFRINRMSNMSFSNPQGTSTKNTTTTYSSNKPTSTKQNEGCYIATMVYGNYDHPQVKILRAYRDNVLKNLWWGPTFINLYYNISPKLVKLLRKRKNINKIIKNILDNIITKLN